MIIKNLYCTTKITWQSNTYSNEGKAFYDNIKKYFGYYKFGVIKFEKPNPNPDPNNNNHAPLINRKANSKLYDGPKNIKTTLQNCSDKVEELVKDSVLAFETNLGLNKDMELWKSIFFLYKPETDFEKYVPTKSILKKKTDSDDELILNDEFKFTLELLKPLNTVLKPTTTKLWKPIEK